MKKMKFFAIAALALVTGITSCSNDDVNTDNVSDVKEKNVYLKMENAPQVSNRSDSESGLTKKAVLTTGVVIFTNNGFITRYVNLSTTGSASYSTPNSDVVPTINITNMSGAGVQFESINADRVYIIGNRLASQLPGLPTQASDGTLPTTTNIATVIDAAASHLDATIADDLNDGAHANVPLFGTNTFTQVSGINYQSAIELVPVVARLEIKEIFASDVTFDLSGIFINNYYTKAKVDGIIPTGDFLKNNTNITTNYLEAYHATALRDWSATSLGNKTGNASVGLSVKPSNGNVWGYNVFAAKNVDAADKKLPRVVLRLKDVKDAEGIELTNGDGVKVDKFITVTGFTNGSEPIKEFKAGFVYTITKIAFNKSNLTDEPEISDRIINATVTVSVRAWADGGVITPEI